MTDALIEVKDDWIKLPSVQTMDQSSRYISNTFGLRGFAVGIDGTHCTFDGAPENLPVGHNSQQYWNRKHDYSLNVQIVGGPDGLIYDVDARWYGSANDARVYAWSEVRRFLEANP